MPNAVFEVTSQWTRRDDEIFKPKTYAEIGVPELFLYDPTEDYLKPPLRGYRLDEDQSYVLVESNADGQIESLELGVALRLEGRDLVMTDAQTGKVLLTEAEREARLHEHQARLVAEPRAAAAEAELARLREEFARSRRAGE